MTTARPSVSFVVIAYNEQANIANCLRSILALGRTTDLEVIVVDDASTDASPETIRALVESDPRVRSVRLPSNRGRGNARAVGVAAARGDLIAMVDGDIVLPPEWLARCTTMLDEQGHDAVGGTAVPDGDVAYLHSRFGLTAKGRPSTMTLTGNNGLYRRRVFDLVALDRSLTEGEDIALAHDMATAGLSMATVPGLKVEHREDKGFLRSLRWLFESGKGASRQLEVYRQVRLPDVAFGGQMVTLGLVAATRRRRYAGLAAFWLSAVTAGHMRASFVLDRRRLGPYLLGGLTDLVFIAAYQCGRLIGHLQRRRPAARRGPG